MAKSKSIPIATAIISVLRVRTTNLSSTECPHCNELNFVEVEEKQFGQSLRHPCSVCGNDYYIKLPK